MISIYKYRISKIIFVAIFILLSASIKMFGQVLKKPIPNHLVILTFDDAVSTDYTVIAPILKKYGFGGTFFITEFPDFKNKHDYLSWEQIKKLHEMGFEIGNHTAHHHHVPGMNRKQFTKSLDYIERKCRKYDIPKPVDFAYPGWRVASYGFKVLKKKGYWFARAGGNRPYNPGKDYPYLIPSYNVGGLNSTKVMHAIRQAMDGKIVVLTIHGVPDFAHPWVTTPPHLFKKYMRYMHDHHYKVIALKDLKKYVDPQKALRKLTPHINDNIQNIQKKKGS